MVVALLVWYTILFIGMPIHCMISLCSFIVKILKDGTPKIINMFVLKIEQLSVTVQQCVKKMQIGWVTL